MKKRASKPPKIDDSGLRSRLNSGGGVTLVLGAGVSRSRGVPMWFDLLRETWKTFYGKELYKPEMEFLTRARELCERDGLPKSLVDRLDIRRHPMEIQFAFEQIYAGLRWDDVPALRRRLRLPRSRKRQHNEKDVADLFAEVLRSVLYRDLKRRGGKLDTMSLVAEAVRRSALTPKDRRRVSQVITFNVDDLLEREVNGSRRRFYLAQPICRASDFRPPNRQAIPVYHLHGFVPLKANSYTIFKQDGSLADADPSAESLVFTDEQYWRMVGQPTGFASRVFSNALSDCCVFVGLSMTDINIIRWLAQDRIERGDDLRRLNPDWSVSEQEFDLDEDLSRHYWITDDPVRPRLQTEEAAAAEDESMRSDVIGNTLSRRGVQSIPITSWNSTVFHNWWKECFWA